MSDTQLASGLLFYRLTKIQTQNKMPKCPLSPWPSYHKLFFVRAVKIFIDCITKRVRDNND